MTENQGDSKLFDPEFCESRCPICTRARKGNRFAKVLQSIEMLLTFGACPWGPPGGEPWVTPRCWRRGEHPEARKHCWVRCIGARSRKLVRYAG